MSNSASAQPLLCSLAVFRNILNQELIRSVHGYRDGGGGGEMRWVEREFVFSPTSSTEIVADPMILLHVDDHKFIEGGKIGLWLCILAFNSAENYLSSSSSSIPSILCFSRNRLLELVPSLANDLQKVYMLMSTTADDDKTVRSSFKETCSENDGESSLSKERNFSSSEDQSADSCAPVEPQMGKNELNDQLVPEFRLSLKNRRAAKDRVASISLFDLAKYFNLPIAEASRNLQVGLTVLKRKCREFGIPRWPHRKIKSLDTLIHNLQEEVSRQGEDNEAAAAVKAAARRQQMLESEKEKIERSPFMELQRETKRFRQDVFKRRHKAKALSKMSQSPASSRSSSS